MNERIKLLRKELSLTTEAFGEKLGITRSAVSNIENGHRAVTPQMFKSICREFNINEEWLRTGNGEMFIKRTKNQEIIDFLGELTDGAPDNDFRKRFVIAMSKLSIDEWKVIEKLINNIKKEDGWISAPSRISLN